MQFNINCLSDCDEEHVEMEHRVPFDKDDKHREYNREYAEKFLQIILQVTKVMEIFRAGFTGKASPVHFFLGFI